MGPGPRPAAAPATLGLDGDDHVGDRMFLVDATFSLVIGATAHAVFNLGFAADLGIPLGGLLRHLDP